MKKQPQVTEKTRKKLINNFWNLYKDNNKITIKNICDKAKYDRTSFYRYFDNVDDILREIEDEIINNIRNDIKNKAKSNNDKKILLESFYKFTDDYGEYIIIFNKNGNNNFYRKFKELIKEDVFTYFNFNINSNIKKDLVFEFGFSSLMNSFIYWYNHKNTIDLDLFVEFANSVIMSGVDSILKSNKI